MTKNVRIVEAAKAPGRTMMLALEDDSPVLVALGLRSSTSAPARIKAGILVPVENAAGEIIGNAVLDQFRLEMN